MKNKRLLMAVGGKRADETGKPLGEAYLEATEFGLWTIHVEMFSRVRGESETHADEWETGPSVYEGFLLLSGAGSRFPEDDVKSH